MAPGRKTADLRTFGQGQTGPCRVVDSIYQAHGVGNTNLVVTSAGNVVIDAGPPTTAKAHEELLQTADDGPVRYLHDATVAGMNQGKDVCTLMREIQMPAEFDPLESHARVDPTRAEKPRQPGEACRALQRQAKLDGKTRTS